MDTALEMNHADLKMILFLCLCTGLEEMELKIERDESDKRRESIEQVPAAVSGELLQSSHGNLLVKQLQRGLCPPSINKKCHKVTVLTSS